MRFRIGTLNVHWVMRPKKMDQFVKLVFENKLDILVTQEGQSDAIQKYVNKLNEFEKQQSPDSIYKWNHASVRPSFLCNSIISRYPIMEENSVHWDWLKMKTKTKNNLGSKENRSAVMAKIMIFDENNEVKENEDEEIGDIKMEDNVENIDNKDGMISIMCTHLDHLDEDNRLLQLNHFLDNIMKSDNKKKRRNKNNDKKVECKDIEYPDIICGDFNSLLRSDYTKKEWNKIGDIRIKSQWEEPKSDLMYQLLVNNDKNDDKKLYYDTLGYVLKQKFYTEKYLKKSKDKNKMSFMEFNDKINLPKWSSLMSGNNSENDDKNIFKKLFKSMNKKDVNIKNDNVENNNDLDDEWNELFFEYFAKHWEFTCRFDTRIDYILVLKHLLRGKNKWNLIDFGFVDTMKTNLTDHKLYWCEFERV